MWTLKVHWLGTGGVLVPPSDILARGPWFELKNLSAEKDISYTEAKQLFLSYSYRNSADSKSDIPSKCLNSFLLC